MVYLFLMLRRLIFTAALLIPGALLAGTFDRFEGTYIGSAEFEYQGKVEQRDLSTTITAQEVGFTVNWTSVSFKPDGRTTEKTYNIEFSASERDNIYKSAMKKNLFGKATPLDPLQGEPFVWAYVEGDTLTVYSMFINETGGYEVQEFHRTLADGGLDLLFRRVHNGVPQKEIQTFLERQD